MNTEANVAPLLQMFFTERLIAQRRASPHTIASYRDTFGLLLRFIQRRAGIAPSSLSLQDMDESTVGAFLTHLEHERGNSPRTRNTRLAAVHAFFRFVALREPAHSALAQRVLAIPTKRYERPLIHFLSHLETEVLLAAPDRNTWFGRRDQALLLLTVQTGLRVSELIGLRCQDIVLDHGAHVRCLGKGRKNRSTPLRKDTVKVLREWLRERRGNPKDPLFPNQRGGSLSRDSIEYIVNKYITTATHQCATLKHKRVTPHVLRHTAAMELLQHGVDSAVIALWLGHESVETTQVYLHADLNMKEKALAKTTPTNVPVGRYRPDDQLLVFLENL
jgi:site-specific recombinase XerD